MAKRFDDQIVWITGGGSGIGLAMALEFANRGAHIAVSGRRMEPLQEAVEKIVALGRRAIAIQCDVGDDESVRTTVEAVVAEFGRLDVAIANAGFGVGGAIETLTANQWRRQFDVNVFGTTSSIYWAMPHLRKVGGRMVLIGSVAGTIAAPNLGPYHASKYAVRAIGQTLSMELAGSGVSCTTIQPGFVESEIARVDNNGQHRPEWEDRRPAKLMWPADKAASTIADAVHRRDREFTFTMHGKVLAFLGQHTPGLVHVAATRVVGNKYKRRDEG